MKKLTSLYFIMIFIIISPYVISKEITVIDLHNKSIDQLIKENGKSVITKNMQNSADLKLDEVNSNLDNQNKTKEEKGSKEENSLSNILINDDLLILPKFSDKLSRDDLFFFIKNINYMTSPLLKNELISFLEPSNDLSKDINQEDLNKLIIDTLIKLGNKNKAIRIIQNFGKIDNPAYDNFYKEFKLNFLLSSYRLEDACDYRNDIKEIDSSNQSNFFLKVDIFCLILNEKFDEANLLNSFLTETSENQDLYFQYLYNRLKNENSKNDKQVDNYEIIEQNVFLYSAMHRIGNIPLTGRFLEVDPLNLAMPIILSNSSEISLRLKASHIAYNNKLLDSNSLSALYQAVDFTFNELNNPTEVIFKFENNVEKGMAFFYQHINVQILPEKRLSAIIKFWDFAKTNNLEKIAYELSLKNLDTIEPTNETSIYGSKISRAYTYSRKFDKAKKWLMFSENSVPDNELIYDINSSKLLLNLFNREENTNLSDVLFSNLDLMNEKLIDKNSSEFYNKNEILHIIYSILMKGDSNSNPYSLEKKIYEKRLMPSAFIINSIKKSQYNKNQSQLILIIISSLAEKNWNQIHPTYLKLILDSLRDYKSGDIFNDILIEILTQNNII